MTENSPYHIQLDIFEGPLDLLLHLIKEEKVDIYNIPISRVTEQYIQHLETMSSLNLDIAGEFLVMAATLAHIKSRMLVPPDEAQDDPEEEGKDPRAELVRRLLEYQKYKDAAVRLFARPLLYRDVFKREREEVPNPEISASPAELVEISVFKLVEAFHHLLKRIELQRPHEVSPEEIHVADCVRDLAEAIRGSREGTLSFQELFRGATSKMRVVATFMALLEMLKRGAIRVVQPESFSDIHIMGSPVLYGDWKYDGSDEYNEKSAEISS